MRVVSGCDERQRSAAQNGGSGCGQESLMLNESAIGAAWMEVRCSSGVLFACEHGTAASMCRTDRRRMRRRKPMHGRCCSVPECRNHNGPNQENENQPEDGNRKRTAFRLAFVAGFRSGTHQTANPIPEHSRFSLGAESIHGRSCRGYDKSHSEALHGWVRRVLSGCPPP